MSWALRIIFSTDVFLYGGGFYSWFRQYGQACIPTKTCPDAFIDTVYSQGIWPYDIVAKGSIQVISPGGGEGVTQVETQAYYLATVMA
jgi:glucan 1,3-beta-glucosidase